MGAARKKSSRLLFVFVLVMSVFLPQMVFASGGPTDYQLVIHKFEKEPGTEAGGPGNGSPEQQVEGDPIQGVEFTLKQTHSYDPATDKWTELADGPTLKETTNENGIVVFTSGNGLELGRYSVTETKGPEHVLLNPKTYFVDIPMTSKDGSSLNYNVHIYPKNEIIRSNVTLKKVDETGDALAGVTFNLYKEGESTPFKEGLITNSDGNINIESLGSGNYYFQETDVPDGYALNNTKIKFQVKKSEDINQKIVVEWTNVDGFANNGTVTNYISPEIDKDAEGKKQLDVDRNQVFNYNITIKAPKDIHKYKTLIVTDNLDSRLQYAGSWEVTGASDGAFEFTENGQLLTWSVKDFSKLTPGQEIKITFAAKIRPDAKLESTETGIPNTATLTFDNDRGWFSDKEKPKEPPVVTPTDGGLEITKVDAADQKKLKGAVFKLTDMAGNVINTSQAGGVVTLNGTVISGALDNLVTREDGTFIIKGLTPGTYQLHETKAPTYEDEEGLKSYRLLTKPIEVVIENKKDAKYKVENSKSGWLLPTTGGIGTVLFSSVGLTLMGAALVLYFRRRKSETTA
ncbi:LPXTG-motif cell wall anchor domain-containing protein/fimbrial isopeptide formation D2 domain-containing protein [Bhargavaea ginsengi]|uniref:LPXTG-motif cell wall anchor domain-containing protein/fimbrial isopeptide formation D2 domain-containing protein n=2 Tax=Bhargavaea ginsengi TaxID=426757 RepID=A0A1H6V3I0_9BACL|nr:LPXTG-motif cell wall anchor domain-containing protein/fimbrial isopeptide formation D2 domain-containing protein [Bhargavaea ginsengi]